MGTPTSIVEGYLGACPRLSSTGDASWKLGPCLLVEDILLYVVQRCAALITMFRPSSIQAMFLVGPTYRGVFNGNLLQYQTYDMIDHAFLESNRMHSYSYEELTETASLPGNIALGSLEMFAPPQITSEKTVFVMHAANTTIECMSLNLIQMKLMIAASDPGGMLISIANRNSLHLFRVKNRYDEFEWNSVQCFIDR